MSDDKPKSTLRQLLEEDPATDKHILRYLDLAEELQAAVARNDKQAMLEIGRKLRENARQKQAADLARRTSMEAAVEKAMAETDPDQRVARLLEAFELCAKTRVTAYDDAADKESGDAATRHLFNIAKALDAIPPGRRTALVPFLDSADEGLRVVAAIHLKTMMQDRILPILRELEQKAGSVGMSAMWALVPDPPASPPPAPAVKKPGEP